MFLIAMIAGLADIAMAALQVLGDETGTTGNATIAVRRIFTSRAVDISL